MQKWTGLLGVALALAVAGAVAAGQTTDDAKAPHGGPRGFPGGGPPLDRLLNLSADQREQAKALRQEEQEAVRPLMEQMRPLHERLQQTLESGSADAASVGQIVLDQYAVEQEIKAAHDSFHDRFVALLTPEQQEQLKTFEERAPRGGPGGPGMRRGFGPPFGPPPGGPR